MPFNIKKWKQAQLITSDSTVSKYFPETVQYSTQALEDFLGRYRFVYVKPDGGGQGKGILRISSKSFSSRIASIIKMVLKPRLFLANLSTLFANRLYKVQGFSTKGENIAVEITDLKQVKKIIQPTPFLDKYRSFILQAGINSISKDGLPLGIRVHTQKVNNEWIRSGILGKMVNSEDGIVNRNRGAWAIPFREFVIQQAGMDEKKATELENEITMISLKVSKIFGVKYPWCEECGIDFGIDQNGQPWIFEVNTIPSIAFYSELADKSMYRQIINNRRRRKK
ncbi:YheC/YheD family protein [Bacillus sp. FJAT-49736]|uniref:YheC/YheD family protein n=1 Tax=Bacillus sp. FJAT-49736 TaxID=2833582 RepID=UPI001BCA25BA|nr:YheC/YheD family protein [Bacillus sp. FJAT-49736]MBS4173956.1 YheC/YheD family protein [Bacillus sp. FJAT-49736]